MADDTTFRFLLIGLSIVQTTISVHYLRQARASSTIFQRRDEGLLLSVTIVVFYLAFVAGVVAYYINPAWMAWSAVKIPLWLRWSGVVPLLFGAYWLVWGLHHLGANLTISISTKQDHALITTGPYQWGRHPLYTGGMVESVGLSLMIANWLVAATACCFWVLIAIRTPMEEQKLIEQFGDDYREYVARTGRFLPRVWP